MSSRTSRPNLLFIMDDQHRFDYLGSMGASFLNTPNLDRLAERGVRFTQVTTNCPLCAPSRIALTAGLQPSRLGALDNQSFYPHSVPTYYQRLRDHGYRVGCVGKLDLAKPDRYNGRYGDRPRVFGLGFTHPEECEGKEHAGGSPTPIGPYTHYLHDRGLLRAFYEDYQKRRAKGWREGALHDSVLPTDAFEDAYIGQRAAEWIERIPDDFPWYLFVGFVGPHGPFDPPTDYADRYRTADVPGPVQDSMEGKPGWLENPRSQRKLRLNMSSEEVAVLRRQYCGLIELIDDQVGLIIDTLKGCGLLENTYIVFASDHGEMLGDHGLHGKWVAYEPSLRVPVIIAGPGIEGGRVSDALVELIDVNPTICELAGLPPQENIDARSFSPVLRGEAAQHRTETVSVIRNFRCIRTERHKLIQNYNDVVELYDLEDDPHELRNIAREQPDLVRSLIERMRERFLEGKWLR